MHVPEMTTNEFKLVLIESTITAYKNTKSADNILGRIYAILCYTDEQVKSIKKQILETKKAESTTTAQTANALEKGDNSKLQNNMTPVKGETLDSQNQND